MEWTRIDGTTIESSAAVDPGAFTANEGTPAAADAYSVGAATATFVGVSSGTQTAAMSAAGVATATATNSYNTSASGQSIGLATAITKGSAISRSSASSVGVATVSAVNQQATQGTFSGAGSCTATASGYGFYFRERRYNGTVDMTDYVRNR